ncbi:SDR family NAD(P)-dependent oxidoreductase [Mycobacterium sp. PDNC021]|uniref:SDR family NAD(P)-dependent oxidoreductase n=1 Tax=Mycobacterium sp. PDNC021 TaxID=3391399 RepID=UPI003AB020BD
MSEPLSTCPTVLVTGATDGIGYATARQFADDGATVYLHAPDRDSGEEALTRLVNDGAEAQRLNLVVADFTRLGEVSDLADTLAEALPKLDVLVNNAAVAGPEQRTYTPDGHEIAFQVNYLAPYLLTTKLASKLVCSRGRVVNLSSVMHRGGSISWNNLSRVHQYSPLAVYAQSKLALTMHTKSIAEASGDSFAAFSVHPGMFATRMLPVYGDSGQPVEEAATILTTLSSRTHPVIDGAFYDGVEPARAAAIVANPRARIRLQKLTSRLLEPVLN